MAGLTDKVRKLSDDKNFAVLSTVEPDGRNPDGLVVEELSRKYLGGPYPGFAGPNPQWVIGRITADKVTTTWPSS
jgi:hypothetical protein